MVSGPMPGRPDFSSGALPALPSWCICSGLLPFSAATWCHRGKKPRAPNNYPLLMRVQRNCESSLRSRRTRRKWSMSHETLGSAARQENKYWICPLNIPIFPLGAPYPESWELLNRISLDFCAPFLQLDGKKLSLPSGAFLNCLRSRSRRTSGY